MTVRDGYMDESSDRLGWRGAVAVVVFGLSLYLIGLGGDVWVLTQHEVFAAQPAREMLRDGHWIIQTFGGLPRLNKPPTMGWIIALFITCFQSEAEWVVRLPSVLAGIGLAVAMAAVGARYLGRTAGIATGLCQLTFYYVLKQARLAEADMLLGLVVGVAMWASLNRPRAAIVIIWICVGFATLLKGPLGPAVIGCAVVAQMVVARFLTERASVDRTPRTAHLAGGAPIASSARSNARRRIVSHVIGGTVCLAIILPWPILAYLQNPEIGLIGLRETAGRFRGEMGGREPWYFYFIQIPLALLPWTPLAIFGSVLLARRHRQLFKHLACWFLPGLAILSFSAWKHLHYAIPILPGLSIVAAIGMVQFMRWASTRPTWSRQLAAVLWVTGCAAVGWLVTRHVPRLGQASTVLLGVVAVGGLIALWREHQRDLPGQMAATFATAWMVLVGTQLLIMPRFDGYRPSAEFAGRVSHHAGADVDAPVYFFKTGEAHAIYYIQRSVARIETDALPKIQRALHNSPTGEIEIVVRETDLARLRSIGTVVKLDAASIPQKAALWFVRLIQPKTDSMPSRDDQVVDP